jgi:leader peptidase (prepilin peptidase)/N-methyltransferase
MAIGALLMWGGLRVLQLASKGDLGSGDVRLGGLLGMYLGWMSYGALLVALVAASVIAGVYALTTVASGKANRSTRFAFGPFLIVGSVLAVLR